MIQTEDLNITGVNPLTAPKFIKAEYPITDKASETVLSFANRLKMYWMKRIPGNW